MRPLSCVATVSLLTFSLFAAPAHAERAPIPTLTKDPYLGAITVDANTGRVLFEDQADTLCFPASIVKVMDLLVILEDVKAGKLKLTDIITTTAEASNIGGSQVYLREHEAFPIDDLLYALMVQSANDVAAALAIGICGSREAFVTRMNARAAAIGMTHTTYHSVHGLPPAKNQLPDQSTARDLALLGRELLKHPEALRYCSTIKRGFRNDSYLMENHNNLLGQGGCDGFKTGYFRAAGYSILATAQQNGKRVIVAVVGSTSKKARDTAAARLLAEGLAIATPPPPPPPLRPKPAVVPAEVDEPASPPPPASRGWDWKSYLGIAVGLAVIVFVMRRRR